MKNEVKTKLHPKVLEKLWERVQDEQNEGTETTIEEEVQWAIIHYLNARQYFPGRHPDPGYDFFDRSYILENFTKESLK